MRKTRVEEIRKTDNILKKMHERNKGKEGGKLSDHQRE